ncbi:FAD-binding protein [Flavobacterium amniphilum]|uniref:FAD-binding protein n=1 Tax=Flavobacterium amniphilum TaxID=1834035 RepID=UPI00202A48BD|nr:FAD-binding protein [Flavobacterium amniphilum]MCL9804942.1 FAD-binding protein [Flavobacterium amniphilum]
MANTVTKKIKSWNTLHENGPFTPSQFMHQTKPDKTITGLLTCYNDSAKEIQRLLKQALDANEGFRAFGSRWSMSHIAHQRDNMHDNSYMNLKMAVQKQDLHTNSTHDAANIFIFQCGNTVKEIHNFVNLTGKSLKASGASNGQTIAGCISTGVHGSALDQGSVQDYVVGLNIITGPDPQDIVYLERATEPCLSDAFISQTHSRIIRDDGLFNAALVGLGSFGFIHGVVVVTEERFLLNRYVKRIPKTEALKLATTMDFKGTSTIIPEEVDAQGKGLRPYHYKIFINPYVDSNDFVIELMYKKPYRSGYPDPVPHVKKSIYRDLILLFIKIAENWKGTIPKLIKILEKSILPQTDTNITGTLGEIFWDAGYQGPAFACSVGIDYKDSAKALELLTKLAKKEGPIPGIYAMRFVKQSKATLAFTRFPITCMLEIDGIIWDPAKNKKMITLEKFCTRMIEVLKENNIPFTIHWGKNADWSFPGLVNHMYGNDAAKWKQHRTGFLSQKAQKLFSNKFLEDIGLG